MKKAFFKTIGIIFVAVFILTISWQNTSFARMKLKSSSPKTSQPAPAKETGAINRAAAVTPADSSTKSLGSSVLTKQPVQQTAILTTLPGPESPQQKAGFMGSAPSAGITVKVTVIDLPPTGNVIINSGADYTNNPSVILTLSASDAESSVAKMSFSNDNISWSTEEPYVVSKDWILSAGDGAKSVYVKFCDSSGHWSGAFFSGITLDTVKPVVAITSPVDGAVIND